MRPLPGFVCQGLLGPIAGVKDQHGSDHTAGVNNQHGWRWCPPDRRASVRQDCLAICVCAQCPKRSRLHQSLSLYTCTSLRPWSGIACSHLLGPFAGVNSQHGWRWCSPARQPVCAALTLLRLLGVHPGVACWLVFCLPLPGRGSHALRLRPLSALLNRFAVRVTHRLLIVMFSIYGFWLVTVHASHPLHLRVAHLHAIRRQQ